jgi:replicative DNA helicase
MNPLDRQLPQDLDAERATLGSMLQEAECIAGVRAILKSPRSFSNEPHQRLYAAILAIHDRGEPIDSVPLKAELESRGQWEGVGEFEGVARILSAVPSALRAEHYARIVLDRWHERQLIQVAHQTIERAYANGLTTDDRIAAAVRDVSAIEAGRISGEPRPVGELLSEALAELADPGASGVQTGYWAWDDLTCGFRPGELTLIGGLRSSGKSAVLFNLADTIATGGLPVGFVSIEMSRSQCAMRLLCSRSGVPYIAFLRGDLTPDQQAAADDAAARIEKLPLLIDDPSAPTVVELSAQARAMKRANGIRILFVDYLQLITPARDGDKNRNIQVGRIGRELKALAKDIGIPVVAAAQLNRDPTKRVGGRPQLSDFRDSGELEQHADCAVLLWVKEETENVPMEGGGVTITRQAPPSKVTFCLDKQRNGPTKEFELGWEPHRMRFTNMGISTAVAPSASETQRGMGW